MYETDSLPFAQTFPLFFFFALKVLHPETPSVPDKPGQMAGQCNLKWDIWVIIA